MHHPGSHTACCHICLCERIPKSKCNMEVFATLCWSCLSLPIWPVAGLSVRALLTCSCLPSFKTGKLRGEVVINWIIGMLSLKGRFVSRKWLLVRGKTTSLRPNTPDGDFICSVKSYITSKTVQMKQNSQEKKLVLTFVFFPRLSLHHLSSQVTAGHGGWFTPAGAQTS